MTTALEKPIKKFFLNLNIILHIVYVKLLIYKYFMLINVTASEQNDVVLILQYVFFTIGDFSSRKTTQIFNFENGF